MPGCSALVRIAFLAHLPECDFADYGIEFDAARASSRIAIGAFSTIEGAFLRGFQQYLNSRIHAVSFSPYVHYAQSNDVTDKLRVTILPAKKSTGMAAGWLPRGRAVAKIMRDNPPDLIHAMRNIEGYGLMSLMCKQPSIITVEEMLSGISVPYRLRPSFTVARIVERFVMRRAANLVAISNHIKFHCRNLGATGGISVIPNAAGSAFYQGPPAEPKHFIFVGRLSPEKGLKDAIQAMEFLDGGCATARLVVVGSASGPDGERHVDECRRLAASLSPRIMVDFVGPMRSDSVAPLMRQAYALIMPSTAKYEGMGLVIAEALAAGVPVITYNSGPMPEFVKHEVSGFTVPVGDTAAIAKAMLQLISDPSLLERMRKSAAEAGQRYTLERVCHEYGTLFESVLSSDCRLHS